MNSFQSIQLFISINFLVIGVSHFLQPKIWIDFFQFFYKMGNTGNILNAMLALGMGSIVLSFHFIWTWPLILVTLFGLMQLIKGLIYLVFPAIGLKSIGKVNPKTNKFKLVGLMMFVMSIVLIITLITDGAF